MTQTLRLLGLAALMAVASTGDAQETVKLYAAGSLRGAITEIGAAFAKATGVAVEGTFGPSGLLLKRIVGGERADVFASANMEHPEALAASGRSGPVVMFARNRLCALAAPGLGVTTTSLLDRMLDPAVKLGISTPKADPSGDYALQLFEKAEILRPGARAALGAKALKLTGGPDSPAPPPDRTLYGVLVAERKADVFLTYCTNARQAKAEVPSLKIVAVPEAFAVGANYGMTVTAGAGPVAVRFALFAMSVPGQQILANHGFAPVSLP